MNYFYRDSQGREIGPLPMSALSQLRQSGLLSDVTLVRAEGESGWVEFSKVNAEPATSTAPVSPSNDTPSPAPIKVDRMARAKKFSWLLFVLAVLCFLLPFVEATNQQHQVSVSGFSLITGKGGLSPNASLVLGLTIVALILAISRKPFGLFLSAVSGFIGVASLFMLKSSLDQVAARGSEVLSIQEGFWLACALLASGAVVQLILFRQSRVSESWKFRKPHCVTIACLILAVGVFYIAPVIYDNQANVAPSNQVLVTEIATKMPTGFQRFKVLTTEPKFDKTGEQVSGKAKITLALIAPLYSTDDFARRALEKGDDPQAFATALTQRSSLPQDLAPIIPNSRTSPIYAVAKPEGVQISVEVDFSGSKVPRSWSFADALNNWSKHRAWTMDKINWPQAPSEFSGLASRMELPRGALILEDSSTQQTLQNYVESRHAFVASVDAAETLSLKRTIERTVSDAVRIDASRNFRPNNAYSQPNVKVNFPDGSLTDNTKHTFTASIVLEQTVDLYRLAKVQPPQWPEFQAGSPYMIAKNTVNRFRLNTVVPGSQNVRVYELASPAHTQVTGSLQIEVKDSNIAPTLSSIQWQSQNDNGAEQMVTVQNVGQDSLFVTTDPNLPSVDAYRAKMKKFADEVNIPQQGMTWFVLPLNMGFAWIPPGTFTKGITADERTLAAKLMSGSSPTAFSEEVPQSQVTLTKGFWMAQNLVTQSQWQAVMGTTLTQERDKALNLLGKLLLSGTDAMPVGGSGPNFPMHFVTWEAAMEFCRKLTASEIAANLLPNGYEYTLPTDAQWEYACRAGTTSWYYFGDISSNFDNFGWYDGNSAKTTHPVGQKQPNAWGLYDMLGNVWEWCLDWYAPNVAGSVTDPTGPSTGTARTLRGGSFMQPAMLDHSAERNHFDPTLRSQDLGFRIVLVPKN